MTYQRSTNLLNTVLAIFFLLQPSQPTYSPLIQPFVWLPLKSTIEEPNSVWCVRQAGEATGLSNEPSCAMNYND
ncbi:hypothetical protein HMPREF6485_2274 [Segatella buccae ATCC 33574]|uniref:Uncharacterized protein n=2 Tax=Segatella buccae TaxID=28126 RepID=E6K9I8_9BACT|nr:hypothetical protein HMPREF6485_2274 [Segatella buccae ATCC 33574]